MDYTDRKRLIEAVQTRGCVYVMPPRNATGCPGWSSKEEPWQTGPLPQGGEVAVIEVRGEHMRNDRAAWVDGERDGWRSTLSGNFIGRPGAVFTGVEWRWVTRPQGAPDTALVNMATIRRLERERDDARAELASVRERALTDAADRLDALQRQPHDAAKWLRKLARES